MPRRPGSRSTARAVNPRGSGTPDIVQIARLFAVVWPVLGTIASRYRTLPTDSGRHQVPIRIHGEPPRATEPFACEAAARRAEAGPGLVGLRPRHPGRSVGSAPRTVGGPGLPACGHPFERPRPARQVMPRRAIGRPGVDRACTTARSCAAPPERRERRQQTSASLAASHPSANPGARRARGARARARAAGSQPLAARRLSLAPQRRGLHAVVRRNRSRRVYRVGLYSRRQRAGLYGILLRATAGIAVGFAVIGLTAFCSAAVRAARRARARGAAGRARGEPDADRLRTVRGREHVQAPRAGVRRRAARDVDRAARRRTDLRGFDSSASRGLTVSARSFPTTARSPWTPRCTAIARRATWTRS